MGEICACVVPPLNPIPCFAISSHDYLRRAPDLAPFIAMPHDNETESRHGKFPRLASDRCRLGIEAIRNLRSDSGGLELYRGVLTSVAVYKAVLTRDHPARWIAGDQFRLIFKRSKHHRFMGCRLNAFQRAAKIMRVGRCRCRYCRQGGCETECTHRKSQ